MEINGLLEVIQVQRHDFLNHLQVISGLLQLNKPERVRDYIKEVCFEYERLSRIIHLKFPEVTAALLVNHNEAVKHQVEVVYNIQTTLEDCLVPGNVVVEVLQEVLKQSLACLAPPEVSKRRLEISIQNGENKYTLRCYFPEPLDDAAVKAQARLAVLNEMLAAWGGRVNFVFTREGGEIFLILPRRQA